MRVKRHGATADSEGMIISQEQVDRVIEYVRSGFGESDRIVLPSISPDLEARVRASVEAAPEVRPERLAQARSDIAGGVLNSRDVADKMIARVLSDSIG